MATMTVVLIRHGESEANVAATAAEASGAEVIAVTQRDPDVPLTSLGRQQARSLGVRLESELGADFRSHSRIWSSPYRRAVETANLALGPGTSIAVDERLRDRELGVIDALTMRGLQTRLPSEFERRRWLGKFYYRPPAGESWTDIALRVRSFLSDVDWTQGGTVVVFAHDAIVSLFLYALLGLTEAELAELIGGTPVSNASVTTLCRDDDGTWVLRSLADDSHLKRAGVPVTDHQGVNDVER